MIRNTFRRFALLLFGIYLALLPGSTVVVALDRVPEWGAGMGGALLLLQGGAALCWLLGQHGRRGGIAALLVFALAWGIEHAGVTSGVPFGRYHYTSVLQPQLFGTVPLAIPCAWLMVAAGAWQLATSGDRRPTTGGRRVMGKRAVPSVVSRQWPVVVAATLILLLDLQIETVATKINRYWIWLDSGPYYGVPTANFVAWWLVGLVMAAVVALALGRLGDREIGRHAEEGIGRPEELAIFRVSIAPSLQVSLSHVSQRLPAYLYLLSTLMFTIVNTARGYSMAGLLGALTLLVVCATYLSRAANLFNPETRRRGETS